MANSQKAIWANPEGRARQARDVLLGKGLRTGWGRDM